ncbi:MAG TPA: carboxypeptidase regulatory-like domain-containing protein, partial [Vicinamibacteria bacterium]
MPSFGRARRWALAAVIGLLGALPRPLAAQSVSGTIVGSVVDASGQVVAGATVTLVNERTGENRHTQSTQNGAFVFPALQPGAYTVRVELSGFQTHERQHNILTANERLSVGELPLKTGEVVETITVTAQGASVETDSSARAALIDSKQLEMVAVRSRDITAMLKVLPGVTASDAYTEQESLGGSFGSRVPNISGARESFSTITVDGLAGNDMGTPAVFSSTLGFDSIGEVKVELTNYRAESGRTGGASVSIVTKSGGQEFHGSLYGYKRHESFNANDSINNRNNVARPIYRHNNLGATLGGPLYVPGLFNEHKDKAFFFYSFEHLDTLT